MGLGFICYLVLAVGHPKKQTEGLFVCLATVVSGTHLSLATGELDVHETAGVLESLHGTALTKLPSACIQMI